MNKKIEMTARKIKTMSIYDTDGLDRVMHLKLGTISSKSRAEAHQSVSGLMGVYYNDKTMIDHGITHYFDNCIVSRSVHGDA